MTALIFLIGVVVGIIVSFGLIWWITTYLMDGAFEDETTYLYAKYEIIPSGLCGETKVNADFADRMVKLYPDQYWIGM